MYFSQFVSRVFRRINKLVRRNSAKGKYMPETWDNFYGFCYKAYQNHGTVGRTAQSAMPLIRDNRI